MILRSFRLAQHWYIPVVPTLNESLRSLSFSLFWLRDSSKHRFFFYYEVLQLFSILVDGAFEEKFAKETSRDKLLYIKPFCVSNSFLHMTWEKMQRAYLCSLCEFKMRANISPYFYQPFLSKILVLRETKKSNSVPFCVFDFKLIISSTISKLITKNDLNAPFG